MDQRLWAKLRVKRLCRVAVTSNGLAFVLCVLAPAQSRAADVPAVTADSAKEPDATTAGAATGQQRVGVLGLSFAGDIPEGHRETFSARLVEGLAAASFEVRAGPVVTRALAGTPKLAACQSEDCYPAAAGRLNVAYLVTGGVEESNKNYDVALAIIDGRTGATIGTSRERCETCGVAEAAEKMALAASALRARLEAVARAPARIVVRSQPAGADATIDDRPVGRTPLDLEVSGGTHRLTLTRAGYNPVSRTFTAVIGVDETLELELLRTATGFAHRKWGYAGVLSGLALIGAGIYAAAIDGRQLDCAADVRDINGSCPRLRDTDALAATLVGVGASLLTLGGVSLWIASHEAESPAASASARHVITGVRGRF